MYSPLLYRGEGKGFYFIILNNLFISGRTFQNNAAVSIENFLPRIWLTGYPYGTARGQARFLRTRREETDASGAADR